MLAVWRHYKVDDGDKSKVDCTLFVFVIIKVFVVWLSCLEEGQKHFLHKQNDKTSKTPA